MAGNKLKDRKNDHLAIFPVTGLPPSLPLAIKSEISPLHSLERIFCLENMPCIMKITKSF